MYRALKITNAGDNKIMQIKLAWLALTTAGTMGLLGCGHLQQDVALKDVAAKDVSVISTESQPPEGKSFSAGWRHFPLPGKTATLYSFTKQHGREALTAKAGVSASMMRREVNIYPANLGDVSFSWHVPQLMASADLAERDLDDAPVRIVLAFEGDKSQFSAKNAMLSELAQMMTGEPLPYATLMYVWCNKRPAGSVVINARTDRIRSVVVESGEKNLRQWLDYRRNIQTDFEKAFGEKPGKLLSVAVMTDSDNTKSHIVAAYGDVRVERK
jgi:Protein of unknown function (DUF3047)